MIPAAFAGVEAQLWLWLVAMIRPGAALLAAPIFGASFVPVQLRLVVSLALGMAAFNAQPFALPDGGLATLSGFLFVAGEILAGLAIGFAVQIGFAAAMLAGEAIGNTMGLGFAAMVDPASGQSNPAVGQFLSLLTTFLFLAIGGHLILATIIVESYRALPPGNAWISSETINGIVLFGGHVFAAGLVVALPVGFALIIVQLIMGMLARSAPSLNLFAVGLPAALLTGMVLLAMSIPVMGETILASIQQGLAVARTVAEG